MRLARCQCVSDIGWYIPKKKTSQNLAKLGTSRTAKVLKAKINDNQLVVLSVLQNFKVQVLFLVGSESTNNNKNNDDDDDDDDDHEKDDCGQMITAHSNRRKNIHLAIS